MPDTHAVLEIVSQEFGVSKEDLLNYELRRHARARRVYWYLCRMYVEAPAKAHRYAERLPRVGGTRVSMANLLKCSHEVLRRACIEVEDRRDDPVFDQRIQKLEDQLIPS